MTRDAMKVLATHCREFDLASLVTSPLLRTGDADILRTRHLCSACLGTRCTSRAPICNEAPTALDERAHRDVRNSSKRSVAGGLAFSLLSDASAHARLTRTREAEPAARSRHDWLTSLGTFDGHRCGRLKLRRSLDALVVLLPSSRISEIHARRVAHAAEPPLLAPCTPHPLDLVAIADAQRLVGDALAVARRAPEGPGFVGIVRSIRRFRWSLARSGRFWLSSKARSGGRSNRGSDLPFLDLSLALLLFRLPDRGRDREWQADCDTAQNSGSVIGSESRACHDQSQDRYGAVRDDRYAGRVAIRSRLAGPIRIRSLHAKRTGRTRERTRDRQNASEQLHGSNLVRSDRAVCVSLHADSHATERSDLTRVC
ncbi:MAG: hypothetical protein QOI20_3240 [Acidimicrobiaceae bacterium]|nr:hypothetical protein [Acidimicrobiaceae bacterium]